MKLNFSAILAFTAIAFAATVPLKSRDGQWDNSCCLSEADANLLATEFGLTISNYTNALAVQLFAEGFMDQSDSVNQLINSGPPPGIPVGLQRQYSYLVTS